MDFNWTGMGGLLLAFATYAIGAIVYIVRIELATHRALAAHHLLMEATVEKEMLKESKARHDLANRVDVQVLSLDNDYRALRDRMGKMVDKDDLLAVEGRLAASIDKLEQRLFRGRDRDQNG